MRIWAVITTGLLVGCTAPQGIYFADTDAASWQEPVAVAVPNADTLSARDLAIVLRCNESFRDDTLTLHISVLAPDTLRFAEPYTLRIPRSRSAAAVSREATIPYRLRTVLADSGTYRFSFTPTRSVRGIEAIGLSIGHNQ